MLFCSFCSLPFIVLHFCVLNVDRFFAQKLPTPHLTFTHHDTHPHRGQVTFTVLPPSGAVHSQAKGKIKVFSSHWPAMAEVPEILAGLSTHPDSQPKSEAARKPHGGWMDTRRARSSPWGGAGAWPLQLNVQQDTDTSQRGAGNFPLTTCQKQTVIPKPIRLF